MPIKYMSLGAAFEEVGFPRPHPTTLWRFYTRGSGGVILKTWMLGGRRVTTKEAVQKFIDQRTAISNSVVLDCQSKRQRELAAELA